MTCREKLAIEHPKYVGSQHIGGCWQCPNDYGYLNPLDSDCPCNYNEEKCSLCWDREIPDNTVVDELIEQAHLYNHEIGEDALRESINALAEQFANSTNRPKIITVSGKAQHGKDTISGFLREYLEEKGKRVLITHYGDLVKYVCTTFFGWNGEKDEAGRTLLQEVGTDRVRTQSPNFWVKFIRDILDHFPDEWDYVLIPDCRFPNEIDFMKESGYDVIDIRVIRSNFISPLTIEQQKHISETILDNRIPNYLIYNGFGLEELRESVRSVGEEIINKYGEQES